MEKEIADVVSGLEDNEDIVGAIIENVQFGEIAKDAVGEDGDNAIKTAAFALVQKIIADHDIENDDSSRDDVLGQVDFKKLADEALESPDLKAKLTKKVTVYIKKYIDGGDADDALNEVTAVDSDDIRRILGKEGIAEVDAATRKLILDHVAGRELTEDDTNEVDDVAFSTSRITELTESDDEVKAAGRQKVLDYFAGLDAADLDILDALRQSLFTEENLSSIIESEKHTIEPKLRSAVSTAVEGLTSNEATSTIKSRLLQSEGFSKAIDLSMQRLADTGRLDEVVLASVEKLMSDDSRGGMRSQLAEKIGDRFVERVAGKFVQLMFTPQRS